MANDPDFMAQAEIALASEKRLWLEDRVRDAKAAGCTWWRASVHPVKKELVLLEAWKQQPVDDDDMLDEGVPRFKLKEG